MQRTSKVDAPRPVPVIAGANREFKSTEPRGCEGRGGPRALAVLRAPPARSGGQSSAPGQMGEAQRVGADGHGGGTRGTTDGRRAALHIICIWPFERAGEGSIMKITAEFSRRIALGIALTLASGCATTTMSPAPTLNGAKLAKPGRIIVYNFISNAADLDADSAASGNYAPAGPVSPQELQVGRQLGAEVAKRLVDDINDMGLTAVVGNDARGPEVGDIVIRGRFTSIDEGSEAKRLMIGFGSGKADLQTVVDGYVMTPDGLRRVGGGSVDSSGGKSPGLVVPILVTAATANPIGLLVGGAVKVGQEVSGNSTIEGAGKRTAEQISERLKTRFEQEGWI